MRPTNNNKLIEYAKKHNIAQTVSGHIHVPYIQLTKIDSTIIKLYSLEQLTTKLHFISSDGNNIISDYFVP